MAALKEGDGGDVHLVGSAALARTLLAHDLIDEVQLMLDPVLLGGGSDSSPTTGRCGRSR